MTRRTLLATAALAPLAGCAGAIPSTPAQWAADVALVAGWMPAVTAAVAGLAHIPAGTVDQINHYAALIVTDATQVSRETAAIVTGTSTAAIVQEVATTVSALASVVLPLLPGGAAIAVILQAALALVPSILAAAGVVAAPETPPVYTPQQARAILAARR